MQQPRSRAIKMKKKKEKKQIQRPLAMNSNRSNGKAGKGGAVVDYRDASTLYLGKVFFMWICIFLDIFFNSAVDHDATFANEQIRFMSVVGQVTTQILILFAFALLLSGTYIVQVGLVGQLWSKLSCVARSVPLSTRKQTAAKH